MERDELFATADVVTVHLLLSRRTRGLIGAEDARAARNEVSRRMLAAAQPRVVDPAPASPGNRRAALTSALLGIPIVALSLYIAFGRPDLPGLPQSERLAAAVEHGFARRAGAEVQQADPLRRAELVTRDAECGDTEAARPGLPRAGAARRGRPRLRRPRLRRTPPSSWELEWQDTTPREGRRALSASEWPLGRGD